MHQLFFIVRNAECAVAEIVSFLLIIAVLAAGIGIYSTAVLPALEASAVEKQQSSITDELCGLKSDIDLLWISGSPASICETLLPRAAGYAGTAATVYFGPGTALSFNHSAGQETVFLASLSCTSPSFHTEKQTLLYEGGAVFYDEAALLPAAVGDTHAVLVVSNDAADVILANTPIVVTAACQQRTEYQDVSGIRVADSAQAAYWRSVLSGVSSITLCTISFSAEAVP